MKKIFLTLSLVALFAHLASAQSLQFVYNGTALADNEIVTVTEYSEEDEFEAGTYVQLFHPNIKNNTNTDINFKILKNEIDIPEGSSNTFCAGVCFHPSTTESGVITLSANSEYTEFHGEFHPVAASTAIVKYTAQQVGGENASATAEVHYKFDPSGIEEVGFTQFAILQGSGICRILYSNHQDVQLDIYSITGRKLSNYVLPASSNSFDLPTTNHKGLAILVFTDKNGKKAAEKVIIK